LKDIAKCGCLIDDALELRIQWMVFVGAVELLATPAPDEQQAQTLELGEFVLDGAEGLARASGQFAEVVFFRRMREEKRKKFGPGARGQKFF